MFFHAKHVHIKSGEDNGVHFPHTRKVSESLKFQFTQKFKARLVRNTSHIYFWCLLLQARDKNLHLISRGGVSNNRALVVAEHNAATAENEIQWGHTL